MGGYISVFYIISKDKIETPCDNNMNPTDDSKSSNIHVSKYKLILDLVICYYIEDIFSLNNYYL